MSVFRCGDCDNIIDGDYEGCEEHPFDDTKCLCIECHGKYSCYYCGEVRYGPMMRYCKITDEYYCEVCG